MNRHQGLLLLFVIAFSPLMVYGQWDVGLEGQAYPAGFIVGPRIGYELNKDGNIYVKVAQNIARRQDFGKHDDERGGGLGCVIGYDRFLKKNWFLGIRADVWWMDIDWKEAGKQGTTKIVVVQPTLVGGYQFHFGDHWSLNPHLAYGVEINIVTKGEDVGQGSILLGGVHLRYKL